MRKLTGKELASELGVTYPWIIMLANAGRIPAIQLKNNPNRWLFDAEEVKNHISTTKDNRILTRHKMDYEKLEQLLKRCHNGEPVSSLCRELGFRRHTVYGYCKRNGIHLKSKGIPKPWKFNSDKRLNIAAEYKEGASANSLGKKYGVSHKTILNYVLETGSLPRTDEDNYRKHGDPAFRGLYDRYKGDAKKRKLCFELTKLEFTKLITEKCFYCGREPRQAFKKGVGRFIYNGIDRVDNSNGYTRENTVTACRKCNSAKNNMTLDVFSAWVKDLLGNNICEKIEELIKRQKSV